MYIPLKTRGLIRIKGPDARDFLQGLVSQDMQRVTGTQAVYGAFLSPQGKFLFDFFGCEIDGTLMLDCEGARLPDFLKRLSLYKLRAKVTLKDASEDFRVYAILSDTAKLGLGDVRGQTVPCHTGIAYMDPRLTAMGGRLVLPQGQPVPDLDMGTVEDYERLRIKLGLPDGARDMDLNKALLLEYGFEELDGVSFTKGCFMGQELTARTRYRGLVKKRLLPVTIDGPPPPPGSPLMTGDRQTGEMKTSLKGQGLALVRLDALNSGEPFTFETTQLTPHVPDWVVFQADKEAS